MMENDQTRLMHNLAILLDPSLSYLNCHRYNTLSVPWAQKQYHTHVCIVCLATVDHVQLCTWRESLSANTLYIWVYYEFNYELVLFRYF